MAVADTQHETVAEAQHSPQRPHEEEFSEKSVDDNRLAEPQNVIPELFVVPSAHRVSIAASDAGSDPTTLLGEERYPEGGLEAWLVVFGSWCGLTASLGIMNTVSTLQLYVGSNQLAAYDEGTVGWIFSLYAFVCFSAGVYIGPAFDKYGPRWLVLTGSICIVASLMLLSICTQYWHFILDLGVLCGIGTALLFTPGFAAPGHFFMERRGFATGIASSGGCIGGVVFPLMLQKLFEQVGWAWAIRIQGFVCLFLCTFCVLLIKKRLPAPRNASPHPDFRIFKDRAFLLTTIGVFMLELGLFIPLADISNYALDAGFDSAFAYQILPIFNAGSVFGRILPGYYGDKIGPFNSNMTSLILNAISCFAVWLTAGSTTPGLVMFALLFGFGTGNNISITPVCVGRLCHTQQYGRYYATLYTVVAFALLIGLPIGGNILKACGGQYWGLIIFTGITQILSFALLAAAKAEKVGWKPWSIF